VASVRSMARRSAACAPPNCVSVRRYGAMRPAVLGRRDPLGWGDGLSAMGVV
jgi:hypothetical protein